MDKTKDPESMGPVGDLIVDMAMWLVTPLSPQLMAFAREERERREFGQALKNDPYGSYTADSDEGPVASYPE